MCALLLKMKKCLIHPLTFSVWFQWKHVVTQKLKRSRHIVGDQNAGASDCISPGRVVLPPVELMDVDPLVMVVPTVEFRTCLKFEKREMIQNSWRNYRKALVCLTTIVKGFPIRRNSLPVLLFDLICQLLPGLFRWLLPTSVPVWRSGCFGRLLGYRPNCWRPLLLLRSSVLAERLMQPTHHIQWL